MSDRAPYTRVYWSVVDDAKFVGIFDDNHHLATWLRLLIVADQSHPASAPIPTGTRKASLQALVDADLVDLGTGHRFRIRGLDAERARRRDAATSRGPSGDRTVPKREANGLYTQGLSKAEQSRDETSKANAREDPREDLEAFLLIHRRAPTPRQRALLDGLLDRHDLTGPKWAADIMLRNPEDAIGALIEADKAYRDERIAEAQAAEAPKPKPRRMRGLPESTKELLAHWAAAEVKDVS